MPDTIIRMLRSNSKHICLSRQCRLWI